MTRQRAIQVLLSTCLPLFTCLRLLLFTRRGSAASGAESAAEKLLREKETAWAEDAARMREDSHAKVSGGRGGANARVILIASDSDGWIDLFVAVAVSAEEKSFV